ncbi:methyl farnesoate epoxidase-like [Metopolophium dirhodum]|uniref:methyl farnesoate epoxidase-like n=1 Tax=Metopolophium dirhodum TaxID=44670 RepID=UPI00298F475E|nr:methyl farnesoate epoxidase-like [Metopolophium dirhodum]
MDSTALDDIKSSLDELKASQEKKISTSQMSTNENLLSEVMERQSRSCNLIIFNLPESKEDSQTKITDYDQLVTIFNTMETNPTKFTCHRLGKPNSNTENKSRPLKVVLSNTIEVFTLLRSQAKLRNSPNWSNIRLASDRTTMQRDHMRNLREQLQKRRDNGENDLIIKYNKGIPISFPDKWKFSFITPIFKKGNKSLVTNYRPISKISILPKIFSKLVNNKIFPLCENILSNEQHGFRPGRSTITNLSIFKQLILESFNNKSQFDVIYTDFEKAFDRVNHSLLITKLKAYGFYDPLLSWIHSFLTNRTQAVKYENYISDRINILSGVPQGDHLSPLLFSIFINDINKILKHSSCLLLADDTKIYKNIKCTNDALELQCDLNSLYQWCIENDMSLNIDKCAIVSFSLKKNTLLFDYTLNNSILTRNYVIKDLGVFFDTKLSFNFHVNYIRNKSYKKLGLVKRMCKDFYDESALKIFYILITVITIIIICCSRIKNMIKFDARRPTRVPLLGNLLEIQKLKNKLGFYHLVWAKLAKCYGQVYSVKFGPIETVVVSGYDAVREVLSKDDFDGQSDGFFFRTRAFYKRLGIVFVDGPMWTEQRKFCMRHLRQLGFCGDVMEKIVIEEVNDLILDITRKYENGKSIEVHGLFEVSVLNGLWAMLAGGRFSLNDSRLARIVELVHESLRMLNMPGGILNQWPFIRYLAPKFSGNKYLKQIINELYMLLKESVEEHKCSENDQEDFISAFLIDIEKNKESLGSFSEEQLVVILLDLFLAGSETTSITLSSVILHLLMNQEVQSKVRAELDAVIGDQEIHPSDKKRLNYLEAVFMEVQRLSNVVPLAIATNRSIRKTTLQDYIIPKDTLVLASIWSVHMDGQHWGDPEVFRPERFLDSKGKIINDSWLMPFGVGRRRCLGEKLAKTYIFMFIAKLIQHFEIRIPHDIQLPDKLQNGIDISQSPVSAFFIPRRRLKAN